MGYWCKLLYCCNMEKYSRSECWKNRLILSLWFVSSITCCVQKHNNFVVTFESLIKVKLVSWPIGWHQSVWCVASTLTGHCLDIRSTIDLCRYCRCTGRRALFGNTHGKHSSAFHYGLLYSHFTMALASIEWWWWRDKTKTILLLYRQKRYSVQLVLQSWLVLFTGFEIDHWIWTD